MNIAKPPELVHPAAFRLLAPFYCASAVHWLAWCDQQTTKRKSRLQLRQLFWPIVVTALTLPIVAVWPEMGVPVTVLVAAAGWAFATGCIHRPL